LAEGASAALTYIAGKVFEGNKELTTLRLCAMKETMKQCNESLHQLTCFLIVTEGFFYKGFAMSKFHLIACRRGGYTVVEN